MWLVTSHRGVKHPITTSILRSMVNRQFCYYRQRWYSDSFFLNEIGNGFHPTLGVGWRSLWSPLRMGQSFRAANNSQNMCMPSPPPRMDDHVYDLYAVCNHHGTGLVGGHYTGEWNQMFVYLFIYLNLFIFVGLLVIPGRFCLTQSLLWS